MFNTLLQLYSGVWKQKAGLAELCGFTLGQLEHKRRRMKLDTRTNFDWLLSSQNHTQMMWGQKLLYFIYAKNDLCKTAINNNLKVSVDCMGLSML